MAKGSHNKKVENIKYIDIEFDKVETALRKKYMKLNSSDSSYVFDWAYQNFYTVKNSLAHMIATYVRTRGGYDAVGLPWSGILAQGSMDARAMLKRNKKNDGDLVDLHWEMFMPQLMKTADGYLSSDSADIYHEYDEMVKSDKVKLTETINELARGAYDEADKTILLFKNADIETILHETFHYFSDVVEKADLMYNKSFEDFFESMNIMKKEFLSRYSIYKSDDNLYYAYDEIYDEPVEFLQIGYKSQEALLEAAAKEMMVNRMARMVRGKITNVAADKTYEGVWLFCSWLKNVTNMLKIDGRKSSKDGFSVLKFIAKKIKKLTYREEKSILENI